MRGTLEVINDTNTNIEHDNDYCYPAAGQRPLIAGWRSFQGFVVGFPVLRLAGIEPQTSASESRHPSSQGIGTIDHWV